jgi:hypothetical protein
MQPHSEHPTLRKGKDVVQEKEAIQEKDEVAVETDHDLTQATEIQVPTPITNPDKKGRERAETKKANRDPVLVPLAITSRKIHATVAVRTTLPVRTCYKRQNDEKNGKKPPHKQANLNVTIDETALMFQQTVVTVFNADQPSDTIRWGETVNHEEIQNKTTNSDQQSSMEGETDMTEDHQDDKEESSHDTEHEDTRANAEIVKTINTLPDNHYAWGISRSNQSLLWWTTQRGTTRTKRLYQMVRHADTQHGRN